MSKSARRRQSCAFGSRHLFCLILSCVAAGTLLFSFEFLHSEEPISSKEVIDAATSANTLETHVDILTNPVVEPDVKDGKQLDVTGVVEAKSEAKLQKLPESIGENNLPLVVEKKLIPTASTWREDGRCGPDWLTAVGETPAECVSTGRAPCCKLETGQCGNTALDCSCGKGCHDFSLTVGGGNIKQHHVDRGCDTKLAATILSTKKPIYRVAVLSSGQWRTYLRNVERLAFDFKTKNFLRKQEISSASESHRRYLIDPMKKYSGLPVDYFVCVDQLGKVVPDFVTEAWGFSRNSQLGRVNHCLKRVQMREKACIKIEGGHGYDVFVKIRPDFFLFSDMPDPRTAMSRDCVMSRFRMAANIGGLTNEHLSFCFCGIRCCGESGSSNGSPGFVVDDMVAIVPKKYASVLWSGKNGPNPFPATWATMGNWFETHMTKMWITHGVKVCPLALRGLPSGSPLLATHVAHTVQCAYTAGGKRLPQTDCGTPHATESSVHKLTPGGFVEGA